MNLEFQLGSCYGDLCRGFGDLSLLFLIYLAGNWILKGFTKGLNPVGSRLLKLPVALSLRATGTCRGTHFVPSDTPNTSTSGRPAERESRLKKVVAPLGPREKILDATQYGRVARLYPAHP